MNKVTEFHVKTKKVIENIRVFFLTASEVEQLQMAEAMMHYDEEYTISCLPQTGEYRR